MNKRRLIGWSCFVLILLVIAIVPYSRHMVLGYLRGESFYRGWPTCSWESELKQWDWAASGPRGHEEESLARRTGYVQRYLSNILPGRAQEAEPFLDGDPEAMPVLFELLQSEDLRVQTIAVGGLGNMGTQAKSVFPILLEMWRKVRKADDSEQIRLCNWIASALRRIDKDAASAANVSNWYLLSASE